MLDRLDHHDGVVDDQTDRQHETEEGERVQRETEEREQGKGAHQRDRHRKGRDQGRAPVLEEDEDHDQHEDHRLHERLLDVLHAGRHGQGGVERGLHLETRREGRDVGIHEFARHVGDLERVTAGKLVDGNDRGGVAVEASGDVVGLGAEFDTCHVLHLHDRTVLVGADHDVGELLLGDQTARGTDRESHLLAGRHRLRAGLARRIHRVLLIDSVVDLLRRDVEVGELGRIKPEAHRIGTRSEDRDARDTGQTGERIDDVDVGVVGEEDRVIPVIVGVEGKADQRRGRRLDDVDALLDHLLGKLGLGLRLTDLRQDLVGGRDRVVGEDDVELRLPRTGIQGVHVLHVVNAVDLLLDRRRHGLLHRHRVGTGIGGRHLDLGRNDVRELGDGQSEQTDHAEDHRDDRDDHGHDGPVNEKLCHDRLVMGTGMVGLLLRRSSGRGLGIGGRGRWNGFGSFLLRG